MSSKSIHTTSKAALGAVFVFLAAAATAQTSMEIKEDAGQLKADQAALERQVKRLEADQARLKSDTASGRMSAESKDAYAVYASKQAMTGEKKDIADDQNAGSQMKADKAALQRQIKRLKVAEARAKSDTASGRMSAESKDAERVYKDKEVVGAEKNQIATDHSTMDTDQKK